MLCGAGDTFLTLFIILGDTFLTLSIILFIVFLPTYGRKADVCYS